MGTSAKKINFRSTVVPMTMVATYFAVSYASYVSLLTLIFSNTSGYDQSTPYALLQLTVPSWVVQGIGGLGLVAWILCYIPSVAVQRWGLAALAAVVAAVGLKLGPTILRLYPLLAACLFGPLIGALGISWFIKRPEKICASLICDGIVLLVVGPLTMIALKTQAPPSLALPTIAYSKIAENSPMASEKTLTFASPGCPRCRQEISDVRGVIKFVSLTKSVEEDSVIDLSIIAYQRGDKETWKVLWGEEPLPVRASIGRERLRPTLSELHQAKLKRLADRALAKQLEVSTLPTKFDCRDDTCRR